MDISVIDIGAEQNHKTAKGGYSSIEVTYKDDNNKVSNKKLMSFGNAEVYKVFKGATKGQVYSVTSVKDDAGYWQWTAASLSTGDAQTSASSGMPQGSKGSTSGGTYATKEERQATQVYIVKQNALTNAANLLKNDKKTPTAKEVTELAQELANWTLGIEKKDPNNFDALESDIPA